jgi:hypothetical protein
VLSVQTMRMKIVGVLLVSVFDSLGHCAQIETDPNTLFPVGDYVDMEVAYPKDGFVGAPPYSHAYSKREIMPVWDRDYSKKFIRVQIQNKVKFDGGFRVPMVIDEIDRDGNLVMYGQTDVKPGRHEPLFYAYLDYRSSTCRIIGSPWEMTKTPSGKEPEDLGWGVLDREFRYDISFPLFLTCPPLLNKANINSSMRYGVAVVFTESTKLAGNDDQVRQTKAVLLKEADPNETIPKKHIRYYDPVSKSVSSEEGSGLKKMRLAVSEIHVWNRDEDWLWDRMERRDADGNLVMRCQVIRRKGVR